MEIVRDSDNNESYLIVQYYGVPHRASHVYVYHKDWSEWASLVLDEQDWVPV
jgi:hypothetical protein